MVHLVVLATTALFVGVLSAPVDQQQTATVQRDSYEPSTYSQDGNQKYYYQEEDPETNELQRLEKEVAQAESAHMLADAIQAEQNLEQGILSSAAAVAIAGLAPGPAGETEEERSKRKELAKEEMEVLEDMVERDKRAVEVIQGILGGSSGGGDTSATTTEDSRQDTSGGSGSSGSGGIIFSLISSFLSGSSSSSSGSRANDDAETDDGSSSGRQFSALGLITSSVSTVLRIKFSIFRTLFSLVKGLLTSS